MENPIEIATKLWRKPFDSVVEGVEEATESLRAFREEFFLEGDVGSLFVPPSRGGPGSHSPEVTLPPPGLFISRNRGGGGKCHFPYRCTR